MRRYVAGKNVTSSILMKRFTRHKASDLEAIIITFDRVSGFYTTNVNLLTL